MLLLFAEDVPAPPVGALGIWVICLFFVGSAVIKIYEVFFKDRMNKTVNDLPVMQSDLKTMSQEIRNDAHREMMEIRTSLASHVTRVELQRFEQQLLTVISDHKELARTTQSQYLDLQRLTSDMRVSQESLRREIREETSKVTTAVTDKIDELAVMFAASGGLHSLKTPGAK